VNADRGRLAVPPNASEPMDSLDGASSSYLASMRAHKLLVVAVMLATLIAAVAWLALRSPSYEASAQMLIAPLPQDDTTFIGLQMLRDSGDPTRTAQTAATLAESPAAADLAAAEMGAGWTADRIREEVSVQPEGQSNILDVTATTGDAEEAAELANVYVRSVTAARNRALHTEVEEQVASGETRIAELPPESAAATTLAGRINRLNGVLETGDPTLTPSAPAVVPSSPTGAGALIVLPLALIAGLVLGGGTAMLYDFTNRRVRDEDELVHRYPLPVLARVPVIKRLARRKAGEPSLLVVPEVREAFRTIVAQLETSRDSDDRTLMITSASTGDGKTTSSVNLAMSLAGIGHSVVLLDLDLRKPDLASRLNIHQTVSIQDVLLQLDQKTGIEQMLVEVPPLRSLKVLSLAVNHDEAILIDALNHRLPNLIASAREQAEYVVIDTAPLGEVSDALRVTQLVDAVILVARLGNTRQRNLEIVRDLLERAGQTPAGYLLVGGDQGTTGAYY
jgi:capsular exopolysaccharide synthesis family protein